MKASAISVDLKKGGLFRYCFKDADGHEFWGRGIYEAINKPTYLSYMDTFTDSDGNPVPPSHFGLPGDQIVETLTEIFLSENNGKTILKLVGDNPFDATMTDEMTKGWNGMFEKLETLLKKV